MNNEIIKQESPKAVADSDLGQYRTILKNLDPNIAVGMCIFNPHQFSKEEITDWLIDFEICMDRVAEAHFGESEAIEIGRGCLYFLKDTDRVPSWHVLLEVPEEIRDECILIIELALLRMECAGMIFTDWESIDQCISFAHDVLENSDGDAQDRIISLSI